ncbi:aryl-alcohol dehydrogenase-like predicted oxidoreductase [Nocardiopsis mwathae]|uniref:Aryl-alcohol dehydrogenase-like predicted oxidoreductase n=1 Tax=Nocardiopsis mwathae TaxID=1472723 RepID=A0A7W9YHQ8_9ACTN|nr:aldo/keto reductase [Nocardiopsis mwathae]MBB6171431.1 aryl-alcohol dehydrogenase-like predicted oxidoreductase [Nocardiopsis mwathae]
MEQRQAGGSGLWVSRTALGTMTWGKDTSEEEAGDQLTSFVDAGGTLIDTADIYTGGHSERIIGRLVTGVVRRDDVIIATKAGHTPEGYRPCDTSRRHLLASLDASLRRLRTDYIDLWQLHVHDPDTPAAETLAAMDAAVASGKVRYIGVGGLTAWQFATYATWQQAAPGSGRSPVVATATEYSLLNRGAEHDLLPAAADRGAGLIAWSALGRGVLSGKYRSGVPEGSRAALPHMAPYVEPYLDERSGRIVESVCTAADGLGVSPLAVALSWVRDRPGVTAAVVGPRTTAQLDGVLAAEDVELPREIREALDDASSAPAR